MLSAPSQSLQHIAHFQMEIDLEASNMCGQRWKDVRFQIQLMRSWHNLSMASMEVSNIPMRHRSIYGYYCAIKDSWQYSWSCTSTMKDDDTKCFERICIQRNGLVSTLLSKWVDFDIISRPETVSQACTSSHPNVTMEFLRRQHFGTMTKKWLDIWNNTNFHVTTETSDQLKSGPH